VITAMSLPRQQSQPELTSLRSPRVNAARRLSRRAQRGKERRFIAEGPQAVREAVAFGTLADGSHSVVEIYTTFEAAERHAELIAQARAERVPVLTATDEVIAAVCQTVTPQGIVAICRFVDTSFESVLAARPQLIALLANVRDPGNAGTVLRTADAAGADAVVLTDASVDLYNPQAVRASVGSLHHLPAPSASPSSRPSPVCARRASGCWPPTARGTATWTPNWTRAPSTPRPPGSSATRPGACRSRPGPWPTRWSGCRSTATPRA
jgi:TrmH family RNA methyltransferase